MTVKDLINKHTDLKCEIEVYREICIFLQDFLPTDSRKAKASIEIDGQFVPDYILEKILNEMSDKIEGLDKEIAECETKMI